MNTNEHGIFFPQYAESGADPRAYSERSVPAGKPPKKSSSAVMIVCIVFGVMTLVSLFFGVYEWAQYIAADDAETRNQLSKMRDAMDQFDQATSICQSMMEHYKAVGYEAMAKIDTEGKTGGKVWPDLVEDGMTFHRSMKFIDIQPDDPNIVLTRDDEDGWYCTDTYTAPGGAVITHRFRSFECTVSWEFEGRERDISLVGVVAP